MTRNWIAPAAVALCVMAGASIVAKPRALAGVATPPLAVAHQDPAAGPSRATARAGPAEARALLDKYCVTCHNQRVRIPAGQPLYLDKADVENLGSDLEVWEKVVRRLQVGSMPPQGSPRPDHGSLDSFARWLTTSLDANAARHPDPGQELIHRLNQTEYSNAVRDLLDLDVDVKSLLPADTASYGFDNVADGLKISPALLERYLTSATFIAGVAVGDPETEAVRTDIRLSLSRSQNVYVEGMPLGTRGGALVQHYFPLDGDYELGGLLYAPPVNTDRGLEGQRVRQEYVIYIDGTPVHRFQFGGPEDNAKAYDSGALNQAFKESVRDAMRTTVPVKAGPHSVAFTFLMQTQAEDESLFRTFARTSQDSTQGGGLPQLEEVFIAGPYNSKGPGDTPSRRRIFTCRAGSDSAGADQTCAKQILTSLSRRAYRRPAEDAELRTLLSFYDRGRARSGFEAGIQLALTYLISSPSFLYRSIAEQSTLAANATYSLSDLELASRLSFFLWSSIPDNQLLDLAIQGKLKGPRVFNQQVRRMLVDRKSRQLAANFAGQWLQLRNLPSVTRNLLDYPDFDENLRDGFGVETELLFDNIVREDRSVLDLLNADYTFINERLARHYAIPGVYGEAFRRVQVADPNRRGLLGHGSILLMTAHPLGATPTIRGKWILSNLIGTPPLPPPPDIPQIPDNSAGATPRTLRARLEQHRANAVCTSCHRNLDPPGFALENFDAVGQWRTTDAGLPIDSAGTLADGSDVDGPVALRKALLKRPEVFVGVLTERLMIYALGRGLEPTDMPAVRQIVAGASRDNWRFSSLVTGIANSLPFRMRMARTDDRFTASKQE